MLISTMNDVPGGKFTAVLGLAVRSRNVGSQFCAYGTAIVTEPIE